MEFEEKKQLVLDAAIEVDGKLTLPCERAHEISRKYDISLREIGEICDAQALKITNCQLGCFP